MTDNTITPLKTIKPLKPLKTVSKNKVCKNGLCSNSQGSQGINQHQNNQKTNFSLQCDKCKKMLDPSLISHFSSLNNRHIHICEDCLIEYDFKKFFIDF